MAACIDAAVLGSLYLRFFCLFLLCFTLPTNSTKHYSPMDLLDIGFRLKGTIGSNFHRTRNIPDEIARPAGSPWVVIGSGRREETKAGLQGWAGG